MASRRNCRKGSRKANRKNNSRKNRKGSRRNSRRNTRRNNMMGGAYNAMDLSLAQGREFNEIHSRQHGGGSPLTGAPVGDQGLLPNELRDIARIGPLDGKLGEIVGMRDPDQVAPAAQSGGGRRNNNYGLNRINTSLLQNGEQANAEENSNFGLNVTGLFQRKNRKGSRKNRKASRKNRKGSRKNRKASRKGRKGSRRNARRNNMMMGGGYPGDGSPLSAPNMLLSPYQAAKAGTADFSNPWLRD